MMKVFFVDDNGRIAVTVGRMRPGVEPVIVETGNLDADGNPVTINVPGIPAETEAQYIARMTVDAQRAGVNFSLIGTDLPVPDDTLTTDWAETETGPALAATGNPRHFRDAWRWDGAAVVVDPVARDEIRMGRVRAIRDKLLVDSDIDITRAMERGQNTAAMATYRQTLRDIPQTHAADLDGIAWPIKP